MSVPYSVFIASLNSTSVNSSYCKLNYTLLNQNDIDISSTTSPFSFNNTSGELKITYFGNGSNGNG